MAMIDYAFLTMLIPKQIEREVDKLSIGNMQTAANALQWKIYNGLCQNLERNVVLLNALPVGSYPQYYKKIKIKEFCFATEFGTENINIGFCNVKLIRNYFQKRNILKALNKWMLSSSNDKVLFVYTLSLPFLSAIVKIKKVYSKLKVCAIVADMPDMLNLSTDKGIFQKKFEKWSADRVYHNIDSIDYFVLLTKYMAEYLKINKPYIVMEGIADDVSNLRPTRYDRKLKFVVYTGMLHKRFGIMDLVRAFMLIGNSNYRLILCGIGDAEADIIKSSKVDSRIVFKGQVSREEVLKIQADATVLVNPRKNTELFTKYSFPSKTMEYLASGTPVVAYKLDGIPDEYDQFINYVPDNSIESLARILTEICEKPESWRKEMGSRAREFVLQNKNCIVQTKKILELIQS